MYKVFLTGASQLHEGVFACHLHADTVAAHLRNCRQRLFTLHC